MTKHPDSRLARRLRKAKKEKNEIATQEARRKEQERASRVWRKLQREQLKEEEADADLSLSVRIGDVDVKHREPSSSDVVSVGLRKT